MLRALVIYRASYYTGVNVASQAQAGRVLVRSFRWEDVGIDLYDMEGKADELG